ncbi:hypothetical protein PGT21_029095 [Puccinia graminis f. sp. tritici]|uniref:Uncharacterized protein n=1 Tax=Puccinia graminis f. sp. tritici TaxID=56615 RepID=A0A5B0PYX7_PUCGR|nr:hypothetical protein PGT21_029095 [Puccinia graminis f. sp. tritici]
MKFSLSTIALTVSFVALLVHANEDGLINIPPCSANAKFCEHGAHCQYPGSTATFKANVIGDPQCKRFACPGTANIFCN